MSFLKVIGDWMFKPVFRDTNSPLSSSVAPQETSEIIEAEVIEVDPAVESINAPISIDSLISIPESPKLPAPITEADRLFNLYFKSINFDRKYDVPYYRKDGKVIRDKVEIEKVLREEFNAAYNNYCISINKAEDLRDLMKEDLKVLKIDTYRVATYASGDFLVINDLEVPLKFIENIDLYIPDKHSKYSSHEGDFITRCHPWVHDSGYGFISVTRGEAEFLKASICVTMNSGRKLYTQVNPFAAEIIFDRINNLWKHQTLKKPNTKKNTKTKRIAK